MGNNASAGGGGGRIIPGTGGAGGGDSGIRGGSGGSAGADGSDGQTQGAGGGGGWGATGGAYTGPNPPIAPGTGGNAVALNGYTVTWAGTFDTQFSTRVLGAVS